MHGTKIKIIMNVITMDVCLTYTQ